VIAEIARELQPPVSPTAVSLWLAGKTTSKRIAAAARAKAKRLMAESKNAA